MAQARSDKEELVKEFENLSVTESESGDEKHSVAKKYRIWYKIGNATPPKNFKGKEKTIQQLCKETEGVKVTHVKIWGDVPEPSALKLVAPSLRRLDLRDIPSRWAKLPENLKVIDISDNPLSQLPGILYDLPQLQSLYARDCGLEDITVLKGLKDLKILDLSYNKNIDVTTLSGYLPRTLTRLYINGCELILDDLKLDFLEELMFLYVSENVAGEKFLNQVCEHTKKLTRLNISRCGLTTLPESMTNLKDLKRLDIRKNPNLKSMAKLECDVVDDLRDDICEAISNLDMPNDCIGEITIIWIWSQKSRESLFYLGNGTQETPLQGNSEGVSTSTHYIVNDRLSELIDNRCGQALKPLSADKKDKLLKGCPKYLVVKALPEYDNAAENYSFCKPDDNIIRPEVEETSESDKPEKYVYKNKGVTDITITEPMSPSEFSSNNLAAFRKIKEEKNQGWNFNNMQKKLKEVTDGLRSHHIRVGQEHQMVSAFILVYCYVDDSNSCNPVARVIPKQGIIMFGNKQSFFYKRSPTNAWVMSVVHLYHENIEALEYGDNRVLSVRFYDDPDKDNNDGDSDDDSMSSNAGEMTAEITHRPREGEIDLSSDIKLTRYQYQDTLTSDEVERLSSPLAWSDADTVQALSDHLDLPITLEDGDKYKVIICRITMISRLEGYKESRVEKLKFREEDCRLGHLDSLLILLGTNTNVELPTEVKHSDSFTSFRMRRMNIQSQALASRLRHCINPEKKKQITGIPMEGHDLLFTKSACSEVLKQDLAFFKRHPPNEKCLKCHAKYEYDVIVDNLKTSQVACKDEKPSPTEADILRKFKSIHEFPRSFRHSTCQIALSTLAPPFNIGSDGELVLETSDCAHMLCHPSDETEIVPENEKLRETLFPEYENLAVA